MRLLIADDIPDNIEPLRLYLRMFTDWEVTFADSGEDALFKYHALKRQRTPVDCVILDVAMPRMTGIEVAREIRATGDDIPIIFWTAYDRAANRHAAEDVQASYLVKGTSYPDMCAVVQSLVEGRQEL